MGRHAGWIAVYGGLAGGADVILIPEQPFDVEEVCNYVRKRREAGKYFSLIVAAEGAYPKEAAGMITKDKTLDSFGHVKLGGVGEFLATEIEKRLGLESRFVVLGHLQRGGTPTAYDRVLATRFGVKAIELLNDGKYGRMVALRGNNILDVSLKEATEKLKTVDLEMLRTAQIFFG